LHIPTPFRTATPVFNSEYYRDLSFSRQTSSLIYYLSLQRLNQPTQIATMGYAQYIEMELYNKSKSRKYTVGGATLAWGKFYQRPNKDQEIGAGDIDGQVVNPGKGFFVCACGRENASSGTEGSVTIYDGDTQVGVIHWDNPWLAGSTNRVWVEGKNDDYAVEIGPYDSKNASIGYVKVELSHSD
jgi:hypothetical protein